MTKKIPTQHEVIYELLQKGKENALTITQLAYRTGYNERTVYQILEDLVIKFGKVIGASRSGEYKGIYIISNDVEFAETVSALQATAQSHLTRIRCLNKNWMEV